MILVDSRSGSKEVLPKFKGLGVDVQISTTEMPFGDFCFEGNGPTGRILIGVERKTIKDLMNSIRTERLSGHQLKGMFDMYQRWYIVVEGIHRCAEDGLLEEPAFPKGWKPVQTGSIRYMYSQLDNFVNSVQEFSPIRFKFTNNSLLTARQVVNLYKFWNDKEYDRHTAMDGSHHAPRVEIGKKWSFARVFASELPGVGADSSKLVAKWFGNVNEMVSASVEDWSVVEVPFGKKTRQLGELKAKKIVERIRETEL